MNWKKPEVLGLFLLVLFLGMAFMPSIFTSYGPQEYFTPYGEPSSEHLLGTNKMGNDIVTELVYGARISLLVGFASAVLSTFIGILIGLFAGYFRGGVDEILMGFTDVVLIIPKIPLIIVLAAFLKPGVWLLIIVLGVLSWESLARVVRSRALQLRETGFVLSARCMGFGPLHIMVSDIFPNLIYIVIPKFMLSTASAMLSEASLSFLGLADPGMDSWGSMIADAFNNGGFIREMWWWYLPPGLCITLCILAVVSISFAFEDEEPRLNLD
jgi:peptide/nickel transport system permease protein